MKFVNVILVFSALVSAELETSKYNDDENLFADMNNVIDRFVPQISQFIVNHGLDPLNLPETQKKLWTDQSNVSSGSMIYGANLILRSGILKNLSQLKRYGNSSLYYESRLLKLDVGFEFELLKATYDYNVKLVFFNMEGGISASTANVRAKIGILFDTINITLSLDKFELEVPNTVKIIIESKNGLMDWLKTLIVNLVAPFFKSTIKDAVQEQAANEIQKFINEINDVITENTLSIPETYKYLMSMNENQMLIF